MKIGRWSDIRWGRCIGLACLLWVILYVGIWFFGGIIDYYHPEWLGWMYD